MTHICPFARRQNQDSSVDSICSNCYQTITTSNSTSDLDSAEQNHLCNPHAEFNHLQWGQIQRAA